MKKSKYGAKLSSYQPAPKDPFAEEFISGSWDDNAVLANSIGLVNGIMCKLIQSDRPNHFLMLTVPEEPQATETAAP